MTVSAKMQHDETAEPNQTDGHEQDDQSGTHGTDPQRTPEPTASNHER